MLNRIEVDNFGPITELKWKKLDKINIIIGENGSGKTFLLKAIYSALKTVERHKRGHEIRNYGEILSEKLYWTFQVDKFRELVQKGSVDPLSFSMWSGKRVFSYQFGRDTLKQINSIQNTFGTRQSNSIFLPAKEVLSLHQVILKSRDHDQSFGFDDTYLDLVRALSRPTTMGKNYREFANSRLKLAQIIGGVITLDESTGTWLFLKGRHKFPIGVTAEGIKKISILDTLLGNRFLDANSIIFIDEPESALHPTAISKLLDIIAILADRGIQFFIASHSYFVIKKLYLLAQQKKWSIPMISFTESGWKTSDLIDGLPENPIIIESIRLYKEEIGLSLQ